MSMFVAEAPAKINRELRVGSRREDGYHSILSRFTSIGLADTLAVEPAPDLRLTVEGAPVPVDDSNMVLRAARLLAGTLSVTASAHIHLTKRIPVGGGLGGGSADAAVTLLLLASLWKAALSAAELRNLGAKLGSDVPYFFVGGEADVEGRGERVTPREDGPAEDLVLLVPPFSLSTADVYVSFDCGNVPSGGTLPKRLEVESSGRFFGPNDLASAVLASNSEMTVYLRAAAEASPDCAMTGSGSVIAMHGVSAESLRTLARNHPECRLLPCRTIGRDEYQRRIHPSGGHSWR